MDCDTAALGTPLLFQANRLLPALRAIQHLVLPLPAPPMSEDCVAFFNHLVSRICSEVLVRVGSGETFDAAVKAILDGELAKHAISESEKWSMDNGSPQMVALFADVGWPAKLKPQVCGLADYVMAEILELSMNERVQGPAKWAFE